MPVPDGRRESCSAKTNSGNCLLAVTADFQVSSYCCLSLLGGQYASTRWQKRTLQCKDKQLFGFARRSLSQYSMAEENPAAQRQTAVTVYFPSKQLFVFAGRMQDPSEQIIWLSHTPRADP